VAFAGGLIIGAFAAGRAIQEGRFPEPLQGIVAVAFSLIGAYCILVCVRAARKSLPNS